MAQRTIRLILNGKKAHLPSIREAVQTVRNSGYTVEVRVTWEDGDAGRMAADALSENVDVIVAGGGDGTVNEVVNGIMNVTTSPQTAMGVVPLGSANDFATGCGISSDNLASALELTATGEPALIDVGRVNERYFLNAVIAGFGATVTFDTSERLKRTIGGAAYGLTGLVTAWKQKPYRARVKWANGELYRTFIFAAVANGSLAGGVTISADGKLDDGLLSAMTIKDFAPSHIPTIVEALKDHGKKNDVVSFNRYRWCEIEADQDIPISPDGEKMYGTHFRFDVVHRQLPFILPPSSKLVGP